MIAFLGRNKHKALFAGLALHAHGCAAAVMRALPDGGVRLERAHWEPGAADTSLAALLKSFPLKGLPVTAVLAPDSYAWVQLEAPDVPADEFADALRWRIKDMVEFPVNNAVLDYIELPQGRRAGAHPLLYVVAAPPASSGFVSDAVKRAGGSLRALDVPEMAIRDLVMHTADPNRVQAYLHLQPGLALIEICGGDTLYLTRHINLPAGLLQSSGEALAGLMENLVLEVQRSLDYFESQFAQGGVDQLFLLPVAPAIESAFLNSATVYLTVPVSVFEPDMVEGIDAITRADMARVLLALGAAIREMPCAA